VIVFGEQRWGNSDIPLDGAAVTVHFVGMPLGCFGRPGRLLGGHIQLRVAYVALERDLDGLLL
jgi:hypothetical protein